MEVQKHGTGQQAQVRITLQDKASLKGYVSSIDPGSLQIADHRWHITVFAHIERARGMGQSTGGWALEGIIVVERISKRLFYL